MKVSDVVTRVRSITGDTVAIQFSDDELISWINDGIRECAIWNNLLQKRATQAAVVGQGDYDLPPDILKLHSIKFNNNKLPVRTLEEFESQYPGASDETGTPDVCYIWAAKLTLYPAPGTTDPLVVDYLYTPALHVNDGPGRDTELYLPVGYHSRIVDYCLAQVAQQDDDISRYQLKMQEFQTGIQQLKSEPESTYDLYPSISVSPRDVGDGVYEW